MSYPESRRSAHVEELHGRRIPDPYRWLEEADSEATRAWVEAQNRLTFSRLEAIPEREPLRERLTTLWNYERYAVPIKGGGRYFFAKNDGLQNQGVVYVLDDLAGEARELLDPNGLSEDGTEALVGFQPSEDGRYLAYGVSSGGSDWMEWRVRDVDSGEDLDHVVRWVKFSGVSWHHDGSGFFYSRYDEPGEGQALAGVNYFQKLYFHRLGTPQSEDELIYERPDQKEWGFDGQVSADGRYLTIHIWQGTDRRSRIYVKDLESPSGEVVPLLDDFDGSYKVVGNDGPVFWLLTDVDAPRGRLIGVRLDAPEREGWIELIPQAEDTLEAIYAAGDQFLALYLHDAYSRVQMFDQEGRPTHELPLPGIGHVLTVWSRQNDPDVFYSYTDATRPTAIFHRRLEPGGRLGQEEVFRRPVVDFEPEDYTTRQVFLTSADGTRIPMFITHRKDLEPGPECPALLQGYGGFNVSMTPSFSVTHLVWMERGGVIAVANLRGGGEYGEPWHKAGTRLEKQNVFDDFIAAAEWLLDHGYCSRETLAITGRSNGGLLVGAMLTQRPDLFGAALLNVGVLDMLRFHRFTIGWAWVSDYGSPDDPEEFEALYAYSPYHNVRPGVSYPATLITTADHDDRVVPAHSYKFTARLQAAQGGPAPILIRVETRAGHGTGKPTSKQIDEAADSLAFLEEALGVSRSAS